MLKNKKALIFDLDGTLIDSMGVWKDIDMEYLEMFDIPFPEDLQSCLEGMNFDDTAMYFKNRFGIEDSLEKIKETWHQMAEYRYGHLVKLKPGVIELLDYAKSNNLKLGIATSNSRRLTELCLKANGIFDYFDYILTACESLKSKPNPDVYLAVSDYLKIDPKDCLVFEDIIAGILAGKNAGMEVCGIDDYNSIYSKDKKIELSDYYIKDYKDICFE